MTTEGRRDRLPRFRVVESLEIHNFWGWFGLVYYNLLIHSHFWNSDLYGFSHKEKLRFFLPSPIGLKSINKGLFLKFLILRIGSKDLRKSLSGIGSPCGFLKHFPLAFFIPFGIL